MALSSKLRPLAIGVLFAGSLAMSACAERGAVYVRTPPPPALRESVVVAPGPNYVWIPGHQAWNGRAYSWAPGRYEVRPARRHNWVPGHWAQTRRGWFWVDGHWR